MDAPLRFGFGDALNAMNARFKLEARIRSFTFDAEGNFFVTADSGFVSGNDLGFVLVNICILQVHPQQIAHKKAGFVATGSSANFDDNVSLIARVFWNQFGF